MRIGISARGLSIPSGGTHQFIRSLIPALQRRRGEDQLVVFYNRREFMGLAPLCTETFIKGENRLWWDFALLPGAIRKLKLDAVIFPKNVIPFFVKCRTFPVIHDLAYFEPQLRAYQFLDTMYMRTLIPQSVRRASAVFAVSESTKRDIVRHTRCHPEKIVVTYEAADDAYHRVDNALHLKEIQQKYGNLPEAFILYTGSLSPRKNIIRLLEAFGSICTKIPHELVLTGSKSWKDTDVHRKISEPTLAGRVRQLGYVEPEDMPALYTLASAYVYPSLYEGFGLPVLEAMQCGCPVVASNATSIPEVAGEAALLVDPSDTHAIANAIHRVLTDSSLRKTLVRLGFERAKMFSWDKCADTMLTTIRQLVNQVE